jgi:hypothetical protein
LTWQSNMTRAQKKQYVIQLHKEGKDFKQIAQLAHMSLRDITAIIKEHQDKIERENGQLEELDNIKSKSKTTQAIKMFSEGKSPTDVVIELDLSPEEVRMIYRQYLETKNMYDFLQVYCQIKNSRYSISSFLRLHKIIEDLGMGEQQLINVLNLANHNQLELLQSKVEYLLNDVNMLTAEKTKCTNHLAILNDRRDQYMREEYMHESYLAQLREEISYLENQSRLPRLENRISGLPYNAEMYSTSSVNSSEVSTYVEDYIHPIPEDRSITPVPSNTGLATSDSSSKLIEDIAWKIFDASADDARIS